MIERKHNGTKNLQQNIEVNRANIIVVGVGRMGCGIALSFAYAGYSVTLVDSEQRSAQQFEELVQSSKQGLQDELSLLERIGILSTPQLDDILQRIAIVSRSAGEEKLADADVIFEAVSEVVEIKKSTYAWLSETAATNAIIASTTSTMLSDTLAEFVVNSARFTNAHWLNPAYLMPLVEISPAQSTHPTTVTRLKALLEGMGKVPIVCKASPGYVIARLQSLVMNEAARIVEEGVASVEDVDKAVKVGFGIRYATLGALEFTDWGGGDILYYASNYLADTLDPHRFSPADIVKHNMDNNRCGLRDGVGFYDYRERDVEAYRHEKLTAFVRLPQHLKLMPASYREARTG